jgi:hypothetical protein|tara:strand:- start:361 stop:606 length:246 start_codon:yes stop_codon:yes gene_type:complete
MIPNIFFVSNLLPLIKYSANRKAKTELRLTIAFDLPGLSHVFSDKNWHGDMMIALIAATAAYFHMSSVSMNLIFSPSIFDL